MRRAGGYSIIIDPDAKGVMEQDTFTCSHCNRVRFLAPRQEPEHRCRQCFGYICELCTGKPCLPLEEQLKMMESPSYKPRRSYRGGLIR
jgi:5-methylcytosine-specific restriction endonuclease McrA